MKTIYELENEIIQREHNTKLEIEKVQGEIIEKIDQNEVKLKDEIIQRMQGEMKSEIEKLVDQNEVKIQTQKEEMEKKIEILEKTNQSQQEDFTRQLDDLKEKIRILSEKVEEKNGLIEQLIRENNKMKSEIKPLVSFRFSSELEPKGVIALLGNSVDLSAGGYTWGLERLMKNDNSYFYNYNGGCPSSENDSYIKFDFGSSRKIDLHSYFIRTNENCPSYFHPKTWRIEGSNDNSSWIKLDRQLNNASLNGSYNKHHFVCQDGKFGNKDNWYRYIRYVQEDNWSNNYPYYVYITYFELYGNIYDD